MNGHPVRVTLHEAWELIDGVWVQINPAVAGVNAALMSAAILTARFGPLPALPLGAFQDLPNRVAPRADWLSQTT